MVWDRTLLTHGASNTTTNLLDCFRCHLVCCMLDDHPDYPVTCLLHPPSSRTSQEQKIWSRVVAIERPTRPSDTDHTLGADKRHTMAYSIFLGTTVCGRGLQKKQLFDRDASLLNMLVTSKSRSEGAWFTPTAGRVISGHPLLLSSLIGSERCNVFRKCLWFAPALAFAQPCSSRYHMTEYKGEGRCQHKDSRDIFHGLYPQRSGRNIVHGCADKHRWEDCLNKRQSARQLHRDALPHELTLIWIYNSHASSNSHAYIETTIYYTSRHTWLPQMNRGQKRRREGYYQFVEINRVKRSEI